MELTDILGLLGGLALFLFGMQMMSGGLEAAAGNRMKQILEKLTANRFLGVIVGAGITAVIQSSSATTVMTVGFVNSGMMTLKQAVWIIMGANIGTTITGQLIALDVGMIAPLFAFIGVAMVVFLKKPKLHHYGSIIAGLGVLFIGMDMMSGSMAPLRESQAFIDLMTQFSNPLLGILAGALFTAVIQSSSASIGILQALAVSGVIGLPSAVYVLFGQNIGTCVTALLASVGASRSAKRTTIIHLLFNVIGTTLFTVLCILSPLTSWMESLTPGNPAAQIANMHTLFNVVTTLLLLPIGTLLVKAATRILPERADETAGRQQLQFIPESMPEYSIGSSAIYSAQIGQELGRMLDMAKENVLRGFHAFRTQDENDLGPIEEQEEYLDYLNKEISLHISRIIVHETNEADSSVISSYLKICGNLERVGDHAVNIGGYTRLLRKNNVRFSPTAEAEMASLQGLCEEAFRYLESPEVGTDGWLTGFHEIEQRFDDITAEYRKNHVLRMKSGDCSADACVIYSEMLTDFERIGDHLLNIGQEFARIRTAGESIPIPAHALPAQGG